MKKKFGIKKNNNNTVLYNLNGIENLTKGDIFFRVNDNDTVDILPKFEYLDKDYLKKIIKTLSEDVEYDYNLIVKKKITI